MYIYIIKCGDKYKIGKTQNLKSRLSTLQTSNPKKLTLINSYQTDYPDMHETALHEMFDPKRLSGEWFDLNNQDLARIDRYFDHTANYIKIPKKEAKRLSQLKHVGNMGELVHIHIYIKNLAKNDTKQFCLDEDEKVFLADRSHFYSEHYMFFSEEHLDALKEIFFSELHKRRIKNQINDIHKAHKQLPGLEEKALKNLILIDNRLNMLRTKLNTH